MLNVVNRNVCLQLTNLTSNFENKLMNQSMDTIVHHIRSVSRTEIAYLFRNKMKFGCLHLIKFDITEDKIPFPEVMA